MTQAYDPNTWKIDTAWSGIQTSSIVSVEIAWSMWDPASEKKIMIVKYRIITNSLRVQKLVIYISVIRFKRTDFLFSYHCEIHP